jgi:HTH-type transcriptional repressor of NAD biosynthesis genes
VTPPRRHHGLVLGKFLPYHAGHAHLIRTARAHVDALTVLVCSVEREPIPGRLRHRWVAAAHPDCHVVHVAEEVPQAPEDDPSFWPIWIDLIARHAGAVDTVFTSELYGDELADRIGARHVCVDIARRDVPVSGTKVRDDPMTFWEFLPPEVRPYFVRRIAILGAESTGKTTLAQRLAQRFDTTWVPEYGRAYCERLDARALSLADFDAIGLGQLAAEGAAAHEANRVLICDTDLLTTCTWSELITGTRPAWLAAAARERSYAHVLLLDADVPWIDDGTRVLRDRRHEHTTLLVDGLRQAGQSYTLLSGSFADRFDEASRIVAETIARKTPASLRVDAFAPDVGR